MPRLLALLLFLLAAPAAWAQGVGFQVLSVPDPQGAPLEVGLWYPSDAPASPQRLGPYTQIVAPDAALRGEGLGLVLISHGAGGNFAGHHDTALALASAGFIVAAPNHRGDTLRDLSLAGTARGLLERSRQLGLVLDYLLQGWPEHARIAPDRIGAFGFSAGGFTVLVAAGGKPDLRRVPVHCELQPGDPSCRLGRRTPGDAVALEAGWTHLPQLRAIVVAAPALGYSFAPHGLAAVHLPVQLWRPMADEVLPNPWHAEMVRRLLPQPPELHEVPEAGHFAFLPPCPEALAASVPELCTDAPGFDRAAFHAELNRAVVGFFQARLGAN